MEEWEPKIEKQRSTQEKCAMLLQHMPPVAALNMYGTMGRHVIARNEDRGRETNKGSGGWVSLSDL